MLNKCFIMLLKQHYVEIRILCNLAPSTVIECNTTVANTKSQLCNNVSDVM